MTEARIRLRQQHTCRCGYAARNLKERVGPMEAVIQSHFAAVLVEPSDNATSEDLADPG
jgi:hypothetical protein